MSYRPEWTAVRAVGAGWVAATHALLVVGVGEVAVVGGVGLDLFPPWLGVGLFLALSIYLLLRTLDEKPATGPYLRRRVLRIWPMYLATCGATFLLVDRNVVHLALNLAFVGTFVPGGQFVGAWWDPSFVLWTLQIEEVAYLTFPLLHRLGRPAQRGTALGLVAVGAAYGLAAAGQGWAYPSLPGAAGWLLAHDYTLPFLWCAAYGAGLAAYVGWRPDARWALPLAASGTVLGNLWRPGAGIAVEVWLPLTVPALAWLVGQTPRGLARRPLVVLGEVSYGLYLVHALALETLGAVGLLVALPVAAGMELATRGRSIVRRLRTDECSNPVGAELAYHSPQTARDGVTRRGELPTGLFRKQMRLRRVYLSGGYITSPTGVHIPALRPRRTRFYRRRDPAARGPVPPKVRQPTAKTGPSVRRSVGPLSDAGAMP